MIFPGISAVRRTNDRHPDVGLTTVGFAALLLIIGLGSQQANGFVVGPQNVNQADGRQSVDIDKLKPLKEYKEDNNRGAVSVDGTFCFGMGLSQSSMLLSTG